MTYAGTIISAEDYQVKDGDKPRFRPDGSPEMGVRITLASNSGIQVLWAQSRPRLAAIAKAVEAVGAEDVELGGYLAVYPVSESEGWYEAVYARPEARVA